MKMQVQALGKSSPILKELRRRIRHRRAGEVIVDGRRLLEDILGQGVPLLELYLASSRLLELPSAWLDSAESCFEIADESFSQIAPTRQSQGVLAIVGERELAPWDLGAGFALYMERIQDPQNVGAMIRSAAGFGARAIWLSSGCADPMSPKALRASAGASFRIPIEREVSLHSAVSRIRAHQGTLLASAIGGKSAGTPGLRQPALLMLGSEGPGLSKDALAAADETLGIPLESGVESLNVAVAAGVLLAGIRAILAGR